MRYPQQQYYRPDPNPWHFILPVLIAIVLLAAAVKYGKLVDRLTNSNQQLTR